MRYEVITTSGSSYREFQSRISDRLEQRWQLVGGLIVDADGNYYQAVAQVQDQPQSSSKLNAEYFAVWWRSPEPSSMESERVDSVAMAIEVSRGRDYMARPGYYIQALHPVTAKWETVFKSFTIPAPGDAPKGYDLIVTEEDLLAFMLANQDDIPITLEDSTTAILSDVPLKWKARFILSCLERGVIPATNTYGVPENPFINRGDRP